MKDQYEAERVLMLPPFLLVLAAGAYAQSAKDPRLDPSVTFSSKYKGQGDPGFVFGTVSNNSSDTYPCVCASSSICLHVLICAGPVMKVGISVFFPLR